MKAILASIIHTILPAWIAKLFVEAPVMSELPVEVQAAIASSAPVVAPSNADAADPAPDLIAKLETILSALGHELPVFWDEAVALAKKAL
ncbi:hypothetical protein [Pseudomonas veronii]